MQQGYDVDVLCALLGAGVNVVTTTGGFHHPGSMDPTCAGASRPPAPPEARRSTARGSSPGFISEAVPVVLTSIQRRLDRLHIAEFADLSSRNSPVLLFDLMGYGQDPSTFDPMRWSLRRRGLRALAPAHRRRARVCRSTRSSRPERWRRRSATSRSPPGRSRPARSPGSG